MAQRAICVASKNRNCRILISFAILAAEIVSERAFTGAQQTETVPSSVSRVRSHEKEALTRCGRTQRPVPSKHGIRTSDRGNFFGAGYSLLRAALDGKIFLTSQLLDTSKPGFLRVLSKARG